MSPAEDTLLLLRLVERHLGSLRGTLDPAVFADEDWGFLAQQSLLQELAACGETVELAPELLDLDDFAVLARYEAEPTPLPAERSCLLELLEELHRELQQRLRLQT